MGFFFERVHKKVGEKRAYAELVKNFDSSSAVIKATINVLRAQVGRKMAKE